ncbi:hypothetical protein [Variovorax sp. SRS16]|uniref:hypothetical protein n=1 Tax=Variovorax sp. SRS16 TaxID=282217 RepID=UPI0013A5667C|nr:hypothetical protein [Variovorax sp. SRS16]
MLRKKGEIADVSHKRFTGRGGGHEQLDNLVGHAIRYTPPDCRIDSFAVKKAAGHPVRRAAAWGLRS